MNKKIIIAPSILSADFSCLADQVVQVEAGGAGVIHIDVMDGHFVPNLTIGPLVTEAIARVTRLPLDVHLMVEEPEGLIKPFFDAGANWITIHSEIDAHHHKLINQIKACGMKAGLALNPGTSLHALDWLLEYLDIVLIMSVNPGYGGQKFIPASIEKIKRAKEMIIAKGKEDDIIVGVDGGVKLDNCVDIAAAGGDLLVMGSAIFGSDDPKELTREAINRLTR
ncbi:MAG: ribulose-phosphate 3-epimerase [bacterium]